METQERWRSVRDPGSKEEIIIGDIFGLWTVIGEGTAIKGKAKRWLCRCACDKTKEVTQHSLVVGSSTQCRQCADRGMFIDLSNKTFGYWTVMSEWRKRPDGKIEWSCNCKCGYHKYIRTDTLRNHQSTGCRKCKTADRVWDPFKAVITSKKWDKRRLETDLDDKYISELFAKQAGKCALSGVDIKFKKHALSPMEEHTASLDRIDSSLGYIAGNVQWIHKDLQSMKWDMSEDRFKSWCELVANHAKDNT